MGDVIRCNSSASFIHARLSGVSSRGVKTPATRNSAESDAAYGTRSPCLRRNVIVRMAKNTVKTIANLRFDGPVSDIASILMSGRICRESAAVHISHVVTQRPRRHSAVRPPQHLDHSARKLQIREERHSRIDRRPPDRVTVAPSVPVIGDWDIDYEVHIPSLDGAYGAVGVLIQLAEDATFDADLFEHLRGSSRRVNRQAQFVADDDRLIGERE